MMKKLMFAAATLLMSGTAFAASPESVIKAASACCEALAACCGLGLGCC